MSDGVVRALSHVRSQLAGMSPVDLALRLIFLDLLLRPIGDWWIRPLTLGLAAAGLLVPSLQRSSGVWLVLFALTGLRVMLTWPLADNHAYLLCYWCLAAALALRHRDTASALARNARWLIALVFGLAVLWKAILSPDYLDQTFFRVTLLLDDRFEGFARLAGGLSSEQLGANRLALEGHFDGPAPSNATAPVLSARFLWVAWLATFWTLGSELLVAGTFLWPRRGRVHRLRHVALLMFCSTTYAVATVEGFGWLLISMGVAQCEPERRTTRWLYLGAFLLILFYREIPWALLLAERLRQG